MHCKCDINSLHTIYGMIIRTKSICVLHVYIKKIHLCVLESLGIELTDTAG